MEKAQYDNSAMLKAVILIGGPQKGTRFRPLSLDTPKPLFPIAGLPLIQHHIAACVKLRECREILIIGSYPAANMAQFVGDMQKEYSVVIRYLQEFTPLGTGGGLYHFRDQIRAGNPAAFFLLNGDVCADFPLKELWDFHTERTNALITIMGTEATRQQSVHYGCMVRDPSTKAVTHYVEKPASYVSALINCGVYVCALGAFNTMQAAFEKKEQDFYSGNCQSCPNPGYMSWEQDVLSPLAGTNKLYAMQITNWWSQVKTPGSAIYANRHYLELHRTHPSQHNNNILPDVYIHPTANVDDSAVVMGQNATVGEWSRVEGTPSDPDPNKPFAKMDNKSLFNADGRLNPSVTILGAGVVVPAETILLNTIVLPHKHLTRSFKHEIIL
ncbi:GDP-mannose pyrophosphorylase A [Choristoneura fumiferana]|uniref:GDP-mannose pyrophosphorylase A n=1 Tax=Choristoneura fumiferana TaxID=7141 RepID=UPI003D15540A